MKPTRVIALVIGCLLVVPGIGMLVGGGGLGLAYAFGRDSEGYFDANLDRVETSTAAVTAEDLTFAAEPGSPDRLLDALDADVRLRVTNASTEREVFVGIGRQADVDAYLAGVAHDEVIDVDEGRTPVYRNRSGTAAVSPPADESFWAESAVGAGTQQLTWNATGGRWAAVVMNADGSPGVAADVNVGAKAGFVLPLALILLGAGLLLTAGSVALIVVGALGSRGSDPSRPGLNAEGASAGAVPLGLAVSGSGPVSLEAWLDPELSRWRWLVKWFLAIPHFVVLVFLWVAFVVLTVVAGFSILFTGSYPRGIFDFNVGVLRWSWRVSYYATTGGIGTDLYPPFSLGPEPSYPATLDIAYPQELSKGLVLVKWWLLAIPHYLIVGLLMGGSFSWFTVNGVGSGFEAGGSGLLGILVLVAGIMLLFKRRYPESLFDLIVGLNRWIYRVIAYAALMTDRYPPFRLDQGGAEPSPSGPDSPAPGARQVDLREPEAVAEEAQT